KTYTEKVWGVPAAEIQADWAAQRIKNLSLGKAVLNSILPKRNQKEITSLIEEFQYPRLGPGMMWEVCRDKVVAGGSTVIMNTQVTTIEHRDGEATVVVSEGRDGVRRRHDCTAVVSSMPLGALVAALDPRPPHDVLAAAA